MRALSRELRETCQDAASPLELAAHLEALGYNRFRVRREFKLESTFELAAVLYAASQRRLTRVNVGPPAHLRPVPLAESAPAAVALLLLLWATLRLGAPPLPLTVWLLAWSQGGGALSWSALQELGPRGGIGVRAMWVFIGCGGVLTLEGAHPAAALLGLTWVMASALQWARLPLAALALALFTVSGSFLSGGAAPLALGSGLALALCAFGNAARSWRYTSLGLPPRVWGRALLYAAYGGAQAALWHLAAKSAAPAWIVGALLLALLAATAAQRPQRLNLHRALWRGVAGAKLRRRGLVLTLRMLGTAALPLLLPPALWLVGAEKEAAASLPFAALATLLAAVNWNLAFDRARLSILAVGGAVLAAFFGLPLLAALGLAALIVALRALHLARSPHAYAGQLI